MSAIMNQLFALGLLTIGAGAFIVKAALNIRDARRKAREAKPLDWRAETAKDFTVLWNVIIIVLMGLMILYFYFRTLLG